MGDEMINLCIVFLVLIGLNGCASVRAIEKNYQNMVDVKDGVNQQEAKIMAQKEIISTYEERAYRVTAPDIRTTEEALKYPEFWFVVFGHNWLSPLSTDALAKTYTELKETLFVVVINKKSGEIVFSGEWYPKRNSSFDWVFNPENYRSKDGLILSPFSKSHKIGKPFVD